MPSHFQVSSAYARLILGAKWLPSTVLLAGSGIDEEHLQTVDFVSADTLMRIYDHIMTVAEGKPRASDAPHFGELRIDVSLSEPDYQIGVDKEQIASMEALHEEIYFSTLHFFDVMGRLARRASRHAGTRRSGRKLVVRHRTHDACRRLQCRGTRVRRG